MSEQATLPPQTTGCLNCPAKPSVLPLNAHLHPGFGWVSLTCDGNEPEAWDEFVSWPTEEIYHGSWESGTIKAGPRKGEAWHAWIGGVIHWTLADELTLRDVEEAVAENPAHDWRIRIDGPMSGFVYQRHGDGQWHLIEKFDGFA